MRTYTTTFLLSLIILLITTHTSAIPTFVDRRFELAAPNSLQEKFANLVEREGIILPRKKSSGGSGSSGAGMNKATGLGFVAAGAAAAALLL